MTKCEDDFQVMQLCKADDSKYVAGTLTNASLNEKGDGFVPSFETATFTYKPSSDEWTTMKSEGIKFQGHGIKITKITLK